jgi:lysozyme
VSAPQQTSPAGRAFIAREEGGHQLKAYRCQAGVLTIGVGHTGSEVREGLTITREQSETLFKLDLVRFEAAVTAAAGATALHPHEFDALVSLAFNIGAAAFEKSSLVRELRAGNWYEAQRQFTVWNRAGGVFSHGLLARRTRELILFATGTYGAASA